MLDLRVGPELGTFVLDTRNLNTLISIYTVSTFYFRIYINCTFPYVHFTYSSLDQSYVRPMTRFDYQAGYWIKVKLIHRFTKARDYALTLISKVPTHVHPLNEYFLYLISYTLLLVYIYFNYLTIQLVFRRPRL